MPHRDTPFNPVFGGLTPPIGNFASPFRSLLNPSLARPVSSARAPALGAQQALATALKPGVGRLGGDGQETSPPAPPAVRGFGFMDALQNVGKMVLGPLGVIDMVGGAIADPKATTPSLIGSAINAITGPSLAPLGPLSGLDAAVAGSQGAGPRGGAGRGGGGMTGGGTGGTGGGTGTAGSSVSGAGGTAGDASPEAGGGGAGRGGGGMTGGGTGGTAPGGTAETGGDPDAPGAGGGGGGERVICTALYHMGLISRKDWHSDLTFTRAHLSPTHIRGYHLWAVPVVRAMRCGRWVRFWRFVAQHRANEISYLTGTRVKPDYMGRLVRMIMEPFCYVMGLLPIITDWQILYEEPQT